jgi:hypothetical protein
MKIKFTRPTIYVSNPIRGSNGEIEKNCRKAEAAARRLRKVFPEVDFYVPAEHDLTMQILTEAQLIDVDAIMMADLTILRACHGWMFYFFEPSGGSLIEWDEAMKSGFTFNQDDWFSSDIEKLSYQQIRNLFSDLVNRTVQRFRSTK